MFKTIAFTRTTNNISRYKHNVDRRRFLKVQTYNDKNNVDGHVNHDLSSSGRVPPKLKPNSKNDLTAILRQFRTLSFPVKKSNMAKNTSISNDIAEIPPGINTGYTNTINNLHGTNTHSYIATNNVIKDGLHIALNQQSLSDSSSTSLVGELLPDSISTPSTYFMQLKSQMQLPENTDNYKTFPVNKNDDITNNLILGPKSANSNIDESGAILAFVREKQMTLNESNGYTRAWGRKPSKINDASKQYSCKDCQGKFGKMEHLKRHIRSVHMGQKPFKCSIW